MRIKGFGIMVPAPFVCLSVFCPYSIAEAWWGRGTEMCRRSLRQQVRGADVPAVGRARNGDRWDRRLHDDAVNRREIEDLRDLIFVVTIWTWTRARQHPLAERRPADRIACSAATRGSIGNVST